MSPIVTIKLSEEQLSLLTLCLHKVETEAREKADKLKTQSNKEAMQDYAMAISDLRFSIYESRHGLV